MMNGGGQPSMPMHPGRGGQHEIQYNPQHHGPYPPQPYAQHPQHFRQPYYQQPPQQWAYYPAMQPMHRPYPHQYQAMMAAPYPMPQIPQSMSPRPGQHVPQHPSARPPHAIYSPPPPDRSMHPIPPVPTQVIPPPIPAVPSRRTPWYPPLPWYSDSSTTFPRAARRKRRRFAPQSPSTPVELPRRDANIEIETSSTQPEPSILEEASVVDQSTSEIASIEASQPSEEVIYPVTTPPVHLEVNTSETPATSFAGSENNSTQPTTPSSIQPPRSAGSTSTVRPAGKVFPVVPVVPHIPSLAKARRKESVSTMGETAQSTNLDEIDGFSTSGDAQPAPQVSENSQESFAPSNNETPPVQRTVPKSWADLVRSKAPPVQQQTNSVTDTISSQINGVSGTGSLAEVLKNFSLDASDNNKLSFVKPRGLVNTGNMCYMNSVLQVLLFCIPFYDFLDKLSKNATHSFKSETPMVDAMILFIREFPVIDAAASAEKLRLRLKNEELEQYGEPFIPEFVYEVIRRLPRFSSMRRGHQQDAEEFLGFLLEEMHEECARSMKGMGVTTIEEATSPVTETSQPEDGWLEVGPKQKSAITRSSGHVSAESPITKIFGGKLRSEFRVPGTKNSVTLEPYQPLQLDIGSPQINNIVDALKGLTRSEIIHGDFNSPRGPGVSATKQVFIETLPPVLILHLKRFQYDNTGGTQKIWKKVGYPLELEIPKEVFPPHKRGGLAVKGGLPKYKLISVVYHHGKSASGGHYTVDVRRQDGSEWIRLDDTVIRRVRSEDVAEGGSEEDPKILAAALEQHKRDQSTSSNIFDQVREEQEESAEAEKGWSHVNGSSYGGSTSKKWSGVVNGTATPTPSSGKRTPINKYSVKDNKVAYILFYQRVSG